MATFWERVAHSVRCMLSVICLFVILVVYRFGFEGWIWVLISPVPGHYSHFTFTLMASRDAMYRDIKLVKQRHHVTRYTKCPANGIFNNQAITLVIVDSGLYGRFRSKSNKYFINRVCFNWIIFDLGKA